MRGQVVIKLRGPQTYYNTLATIDGKKQILKKMFRNLHFWNIVIVNPTMPHVEGENELEESVITVWKTEFESFLCVSKYGV